MIEKPYTKFVSGDAINHKIRIPKWNARANRQENLDSYSGDKTSPDEVYSYFVSFDYNNGRERGLGSCAIKNCNEKNITANLIERFRNILEEKGFGNVVIINVIKLDG